MGSRWDLLVGNLTFQILPVLLNDKYFPLLGPVSWTWNKAATDGHYLSLHSAVWSLSSPREWSEDVPQHIKRSQIPRWSILDQLYKEREEMPIAGFLRAWENSNWADYRVFKEKAELLGSSYKGTTLLANTVVILSESCWGKVAQNAHLNCPLRDRLSQRILQEDSWLEGVPDSREWKTTPVAPVLLKHEIQRHLMECFEGSHLPPWASGDLCESQQRISTPVTLRLCIKPKMCLETNALQSLWEILGGNS